MTELYKKHRPKTLNAVVGQEGTIQALEKFLENEQLPHALLFFGPSGCGKTTLARILREELGCADNDFYELNCADFRGIDMVREIRKHMGYAPAGGDCRVWLIDEAHKLSNDAQNAILKLLEDTPQHVYFFLATTEPGRLIQTIRTRCTKLETKKLSEKDLNILLSRVLKREKKQVPEEVLDQILQDALGSPRMALVLLDKIINLGDEDTMLEAVRTGAEEENEAIELCRMLLGDSPWKSVAKVLKNMRDDPESVRYAVLGYARSVLLGGDKAKAEKAFRVIEAFQYNYFDTKAAGLAASCYSLFHEN